MVILHSYVSVPEGKSLCIFQDFCRSHPRRRFHLCHGLGAVHGRPIALLGLAFAWVNGVQIWLENSHRWNTYVCYILSMYVYVHIITLCLLNSFYLSIYIYIYR